VAGSLMATSPNIGVDLLWGVGGTPEGVLSAAAIKSTSGALLGRMWPRDDDERARTVAAGIDPDRILDEDDLIQGDNCFFAATGVTDGDILKGVRFTSEEAFTTSIVMRSRSGTVRIVEGRHRRDRLRVRI
jgi:fructose-1,6-bisphosphatase II